MHFDSSKIEAAPLPAAHHAMNVQTILSIDIEPLAPSDTTGQALYRFADLDVAHLPVVDAEGCLTTIISADDLLEHIKPDQPIGELRGHGVISIQPDAHWYEAASLLARNHLSALPVVDRAGRYVGLIRRSDLFDRFAGTLSTGSPGAIIILEVSPREFSLSQLVHLIEQSDAKVLSVSTQGQEQGPGYGPLPIHVTVKLNTSDTTRIKHVLDHYGYRVVAAFNEEDTEDAFNHRLAEFLRYLEV
jgi:acetoin utilization protein AcuB